MMKTVMMLTLMIIWKTVLVLVLVFQRDTRVDPLNQRIGADENPSKIILEHVQVFSIPRPPHAPLMVYHFETRTFRLYDISPLTFVASSCFYSSPHFFHCHIHRSGNQMVTWSVPRKTIQLWHRTHHQWSESKQAITWPDELYIPKIRLLVDDVLQILFHHPDLGLCTPDRAFITMDTGVPVFRVAPFHSNHIAVLHHALGIDVYQWSRSHTQLIHLNFFAGNWKQVHFLAPDRIVAVAVAMDAAMASRSQVCIMEIMHCRGFSISQTWSAPFPYRTSAISPSGKWFVVLGNSTLYYYQRDEVRYQFRFSIPLKAEQVYVENSGALCWVDACTVKYSTLNDLWRKRAI